MQKLLLLVACLFCSPAYGQHPAVVRIQRDSSLGSGVLVAVDDRAGYVLTAYHVLRDERGRVLVTFPGVSIHEAAILQQDATWDLALLKIQKPAVAPVELSNAVPQSGLKLTPAGFGDHHGVYNESTGAVVGFSGPVNSRQTDWVVVNAGVRPGDSGGPIFDDQGKLAGILWGGDSGRTYGSHIDRLVMFTQCINGFCPLPPRYQQQGRLTSPIQRQPAQPIQRPLQPVPQPTPGPAPLSPPPAAAANNAANNAACQCDPATKSRLDALDAIAAKLPVLVASIDSRITALEKTAGQPGPAGPKGEPGAAAQVDAAAISAAIDQHLRTKPIVYRILGEHGEVVADGQTYLGGAPMDFQLVPRKKTSE